MDPKQNQVELTVKKYSKFQSFWKIIWPDDKESYLPQDQVKEIKELGGDFTGNRAARRARRKKS